MPSLATGTDEVSGDAEVAPVRFRTTFGLLVRARPEAFCASQLGADQQFFLAVLQPSRHGQQTSGVPQARQHAGGVLH